MKKPKKRKRRKRKQRKLDSQNYFDTRQGMSFRCYYLGDASCRFDYLLMFLGSIGAAVTGMAMPAVLIIFGRLINDLNTTTGLLDSSSEIDNLTDEMYDNIVRVAVYYLYIGIAAWIASYGMFSSLHHSSISTTCMLDVCS